MPASQNEVAEEKREDTDKVTLVAPYEREFEGIKGHRNRMVMHRANNKSAWTRQQHAEEVERMNRQAYQEKMERRSLPNVQPTRTPEEEERTSQQAPEEKMEHLEGDTAHKPDTRSEDRVRRRVSPRPGDFDYARGAKADKPKKTPEEICQK